MTSLSLHLSLAEGYHSPSQRARVMTEHWVATYANCPECATPIKKTPNNRPGLDFECNPCGIPFELKSKRGTFGARIVDGAYRVMVEKITSNTHPNFFLLNYDENYAITSLVLVPKRFIVPEIIEIRKALSSTARRAGWVGCNLKISLIPDAGKISYVRNRSLVAMSTISREWRKTGFLDDVKTPSRGWLVATMSCIERINKHQFTLQDVYKFVPYLQTMFPNNRNVEAKVRQQLQVLRDEGWLSFLGGGNYERK